MISRCIFGSKGPNRVFRWTASPLPPPPPTSSSSSNYVHSRRLLTTPTSTTTSQQQQQRQHDDDHHHHQQQEEHDRLVQEAFALSRSLYRHCWRSIRLIRHGNATDRADFAQRQQAWLEQQQTTTTTTQRSSTELSFLSMMPPLNYQDELQSRSAYYQQYLREHFVQESDCFHQATTTTTSRMQRAGGGGRKQRPHHTSGWVLSEGSITRFHKLLHQGYQQREWLLRDLQYDSANDETTSTNDDDDTSRRIVAVNTTHAVDQWRQRAMAFLQQSSRETGIHANNMENDNVVQDEEEEDDDDDDFFGEDDEDGTVGHPSWYKNPQSH